MADVNPEDNESSNKSETPAKGKPKNNSGVDFSKYPNIVTLGDTIKNETKPAGFISEVTEKVVDHFAEEEKQKWVNAIIAAELKRKSLVAELDKLKPDVIYKNEDGTVATSLWSDGAQKTLTTAKEKLTKFLKAYNEALDPKSPNLGNLQELVK